MRRREGLAGFYKCYSPDQVGNLAEGIEAAKAAASAFGLLRLEIDEDRTAKLKNGNYFIAVRGWTEKMVKEEANAKDAKDQEVAEGEAQADRKPRRSSKRQSVASGEDQGAGRPAKAKQRGRSEAGGSSGSSTGE